MKRAWRLLILLFPSPSRRLLHLYTIWERSGVVCLCVESREEGGESRWMDVTRRWVSIHCHITPAAALLYILLCLPPADMLRSLIDFWRKEEEEEEGVVSSSCSHHHQSISQVLLCMVGGAWMAAGSAAARHPSNEKRTHLPCFYQKKGGRCLWGLGARAEIRPGVSIIKKRRLFLNTVV